MLTKIPLFIGFLIASLWRQGSAMFIVSVLIKSLLWVVIAPASLFVVEGLLSAFGQLGISNQALLGFLLSPVGLLLAIWAIAVFLFGFFLEQAGILSLLMQHEAGRRSVSQAIRMVMQRALELGKLALLQAACLSLFCALALFLGRWLFGLFLAEWDINYYWQQQRLTVWFYFAGLALMLVAPAIWLGRRWLHWWFAVPLALVNTQGFYHQLNASELLSQGFKRQICWVVLLWLGIRALVFSGVLALTLLGSEPILGHELHLGAIYLVLVVAGLMMLLFSFLDCFIYSGLQYYLFRRALFAHRSEVIRHIRHHGGHRQALAKPYRWLFALTSIFALVATLDQFILFAERLQEPHQMKVVAHRGGGELAAENSLIGLEKAIAVDADYSEVDVQLTADGHLFVEHDRDTGRATGQSLVVEQSTLSQLAQAYQIAGREFSTLPQWLAMANGKIGLNIELKRYSQEVDMLPALQRALKDYQGPLLITSLDESLLRSLQQHNWPLGLIVAASVGHSPFSATTDVVLMSDPWLTPLRVLRAQQQGQQVWAWTVDHPQEIQRLFHLGVDGVITENPIAAQSLILREQSLEPVQRLLMSLRYWLSG